MSRSPPRASLRSGSSRYAASPATRNRLVEGGQQLRQSLPGVAAPGVQQGRTCRADQLGVAGEHAEIEQSDAGAQLATGDLGALGRGPDRVVELHAGVPERVPELVGESLDRRLLPVSELATVVQQHEIEVGARAQLAACQAADTGQRHPGRGTAHVVVQLDEGGLDTIGDQTPTIRPCRGNPRGPDRDVETLAG